MKLQIQFGERKGKKLSYPEKTQARPTLARARDVLFNWLISHSYHRVCDLFAGTGILGIEALSLGAEHVQFVDIKKSHLNQIKTVTQQLNFKNKTINFKEQDAFVFLKNAQSPYDLIFVDPPFDKNYHQNLLKELRQSPAVTPQTLIYFESPHEEEFDEQWKVLKEKKISKVKIYLIQKA